MKASFKRVYPNVKQELSVPLKIYLEQDQLYIEDKVYSLEQIEGVYLRFVLPNPRPKESQKALKETPKGFWQKVRAGGIFGLLLIVAVVGFFLSSGSNNDTVTFDTSSSTGSQVDLVLFNDKAPITAISSNQRDQLEAVARKLNFILTGKMTMPGGLYLKQK